LTTRDASNGESLRLMLRNMLDANDALGRM
jgi:hypothetical protein